MNALYCLPPCNFNSNPIKKLLYSDGVPSYIGDGLAGGLARGAAMRTWGFFPLAVLAFAVSVAAARADYSGAHATFLPNEVAGIVLQADGQTPVAGFPVRVWNVDRNRFIFRTVTDQNGNFYVPPLASGESYVLVGRVRVNLSVLQPSDMVVSQRHDLIVALPRRALITGRGVFYQTMITPLGLAIPRETQVVSP